MSFGWGDSFWFPLKGLPIWHGYLRPKTSAPGNPAANDSVKPKTQSPESRSNTCALELEPSAPQTSGSFCVTSHLGLVAYPSLAGLPGLLTVKFVRLVFGAANGLPSKAWGSCGCLEHWAIGRDEEGQHCKNGRDVKLESPPCYGLGIAAFCRNAQACRECRWQRLRHAHCAMALCLAANMRIRLQ